VFSGNIAQSHGGGIQLDEANTQFHDCAFNWNIAEWGGGAHVYLAAGHFYNCLFNGNASLTTTVGGGGGLRGVATILTVSGCTFNANYAAQYGAGIEISNGTELELTATMIAFSTMGGATRRAGDTDVTCTCTNMYGNVGGDWSWGFGGYFGLDGNFSSAPFFCDSESGDFTVDAISPCLPQNNDCGVLIGAYGEGCTLTSVTGPGALSAPSLESNSPNPFNPSTMIRFTLHQAGAVSLAVYNQAGRLIRTLNNKKVYSVGQHVAVWDGVDDSGRAMPSGVYFCRLEAGEYVETQKMTLLK